MRILPPKQELIQIFGDSDFFLWEYYGEGVLGKIQAWIFRSRIKVLMRFLRKARLDPGMILDVGCGPMFISYALISNETSEYIGVDIMSAERLKKYRDAMRSVGVKGIEVIRASAESLPFRKGIFDFALCLDVLEHLSKPMEAALEIYRVVKDDCMVAVSLPLENLFLRMFRMGFILMKIMGHPIIKRAKCIPITRTPDYHYFGDVKSYDEMFKMLKEMFSPLFTRYTPFGVHKTVNMNAVHMLKKRS
jgi:2-polyprenyl-3-methyl-5-hydroxy-6-metoxy-1,4-benzoquinol methylase